MCCCCLLVDNGVVRLWKGLYDGQAPEMLTAWRALPDLIPRPGSIDSPPFSSLHSVSPL